MQQVSPEIQRLVAGGYKLTPATLAMKTTHGWWKPARHLLHISTIVATELARGNARIIVTMPPRHGKSEFISVNVPVWYLDRKQDKRVLLTSYGAELSTDFSRKARDLIIESPELLDVRIKEDARSVLNFITTMGGGVLAAGIGGPITGRGMDLGIVDDYIKNAEDSLSTTNRQKVWDWFLSTFYTRLEPGASIIILATRWNDDDLIGRCLTILPHENWIVINLPAIAEENDPLGRAEGEALWPERWPLETLIRIKETLGDYWFSAMYQQRPKKSMSDAGRGEKINIVTEAELPHINDMKVVRAWDFAATEVPSGVTLTSATDADWTVGLKLMMSKITGRFFIADVNRFRKEPYDTEVIVKATAAVDGPSVPIRIEQEPGSAGKSFIQNYQIKVLPGFAVKGIHPTGPIEFRASAVLAAIEAGKFSMVKAPWNKTVQDEINAFPLGTHDDIVSAMSLAYNNMVLGLQGPVIWGELSKGELTRIMMENQARERVRRTVKREGYITGVTW